MQCASNCQCRDGKSLIDGVCKCPAGTNWKPLPAQGQVAGVCEPISCPQGQAPALSSGPDGNKSICQDIPDEGGGGDECEPPQVSYAGLCRDAEDSPPDCGDTYTTAVFVDGKYVCSNDENCGDGSSPTIHTTPSGSWKVCGDPGDDPDPEDPSSSSPSSAPSSTPSNGGDSSSGSGSGSGGGSGDGSGSDNGSGSGTSAGGQSSSASGGGGGNPPTQSASSTSSGASGWGSSGSAAGNCDPTAHNYLECISRENPGEGGDGIDDVNQKDYGLNIGERLQQARDDYTDRLNQIQDEFSQSVSVSLGSGSGSLPRNTVTLYGESVEMGIYARADFFDAIRWIFLAVASVLSLYIVLSK